MIVEMDTSNYTLIAILLIMIEKKAVHSVAFYFYMFKATEINYNTHNKELLVVFKAFYIWYHYLERSELSIDIITNYKNLEYFSSTKILSYHFMIYLDANILFWFSFLFIYFSWFNFL